MQPLHTVCRINLTTSILYNDKALIRQTATTSAISPAPNTAVVYDYSYGDPEDLLLKVIAWFHRSRKGQPYKKSA